MGDPHERRELIADMAAVIMADGRVDERERALLWHLEVLLAVPVHEVVKRIGPEWPALTTRPHARPRPPRH